MLSGIGLMLLAIVGGYIILERAASHRGDLKRIGQVLGVIVIAVSIVGVGCFVWHVSSGKSGRYGYGKHGKSWQCSYHSKTPYTSQSSK